MDQSLLAYLVYPLPDRKARSCEYWAIRWQRWPGFCTVCGRWVFFRRIESNLRESCLCRHCNATNRQRQLAVVSIRAIGSDHLRRVHSLRRLASMNLATIYNTESAGPIHQQLSPAAGYTCSEYFGPEFLSGQTAGGVLHQDLQSCSFADESFDLVLSSDVLEHIPDPYLAHQEIYRILRKGGRHVFTVPFYHSRFRDEIRCRMENDGKLVHLKKPWYHDDPVRPDQGALVFRVFSAEMLVRLEEIGFTARMYRLYIPRFGIFGSNAIVFEAVK